MFGKLFGGSIKVLAPLSGEVTPVTRVNDPTFSEEMLGKGAAVKPDGGRVVSPVNGTVTQMFETGHAVSLTSEEGVEVLIHVGLDTVKLKGRHFTARAKTGEKVKAGDLLMEFDREAIAAGGFDTVTVIVICNSDDFKKVEMVSAEAVKELDDLIIIKK